MEHSFIKLLSGEDIFNSLNELNIYPNSTSFLLSAVGDLSMVSFKCPLNEKRITFEKKLEIINLSSYLTSKDSHFHITVSDDNCNVYGGHLLSGKTTFLNHYIYYSVLFLILSSKLFQILLILMQL